MPDRVFILAQVIIISPDLRFQAIDGLMGLNINECIVLISEPRTVHHSFSCHF
jgi:hypothetical protein